MSWEPAYAGLLALSTIVDFVVAKMTYRAVGKTKKRLWLSVSVLVNLGVLFTFKYYNFFRTEALGWLTDVGLETWFPMLSVLLPVGISFYTFQTLSYTIDVYQGRQKPEGHLGIFALYVSFFPQLVAGPIERFSHLGPQLKTAINFNQDNIKKGLRLMLYGFFIKMCVADNLAPSVDEVYIHHEQLPSGQILTGLFFYAFQIYSDFHGYSLIAIGAAKLLGIDIMNNFRAPYLANSISEFWKRWHISLTSWFRSYVFLPLGGSRVRVYRWLFNVIVVFIVSGFWHGANWTFIIWGAIHAFIYLLEKITTKLAPAFSIARLPLFIQKLNILKTFLIVTLAWTFFRSNSFEHAQSLLTSLLSNWGLKVEWTIELQLLAILALFVLTDTLFRKRRIDDWLAHQHLALRWGLYGVFVFCIMGLSGVALEPFIYFQF